MGTMNDETLAALHASIKHWEDNARALNTDDVSIGSGDCALCKLFIEGGCRGCPVAARTHKAYCYGSPYDDVEDALVRWGCEPDDDGLREAFRVVADAEVAFLKSLVDEPYVQVPDSRTAISTMTWRRAEDVVPERGCFYLVKTNGGQWRDSDVQLWVAPMLERSMKPEIVRGRPIWVAKVIDPTGEVPHHSIGNDVEFKK